MIWSLIYNNTIFTYILSQLSISTADAAYAWILHAIAPSSLLAAHSPLYAPRECLPVAEVRYT